MAGEIRLIDRYKGMASKLGALQLGRFARDK